MSETLEMTLGTYDVSDRRHPERSGTYIKLTDLLAAIRFLRDEPTGLAQLEHLLIMGGHK